MTTYAPDDVPLLDDEDPAVIAPAPGVRIRAWRQLAGVPYGDGLEPSERRDEGTARAAARWTEEEVARVDAAIRTVARKVLERRPMCPEFTADNVWRELGVEFPVTKGLTGRLIAAVGKGVIYNTHRTTIADRGGRPRPRPAPHRVGRNA
jgi:hypothetical protein